MIMIIDPRIFELVQVPNFTLNRKVWFFGPDFPKSVIFGLKQKKVNIGIKLSRIELVYVQKFGFKQTIIIFTNKIFPEGWINLCVLLCWWYVWSGCRNFYVDTFGRNFYGIFAYCTIGLLFQCLCSLTLKRQLFTKCSKIFKNGNCWLKANPQETADLVTFTEEILNGKLPFLCSEGSALFQESTTTYFYKITFFSVDGLT